MKLPFYKRTKEYSDMKKKMRVLSFVIAAGIIGNTTGCTLSFKTPDNAVVSSETIDVSIDSIKEKVSTAITEADWSAIKDGATDKTEELSTAIKEAANELTKENPQELGEFEEASIVRVVDGDTIIVMVDQYEYKVRLIGVDTPESVASQEYLERTGKENTKEGKDASQFTKDLLSNYDTVYLQKDTSETDRYGRLLRYVWLEIPDNQYDINEIATKMLNGVLISNKVANVATYEPDTKHADDFLMLKEESERE